MERVSIYEGKKPVIVVAPHGYENDDENTSVIAKKLAKSLNCYMVVNNGWERDEVVDCFRDKADCNNTLHCHEDVVKEEFLDPILRFKNRILNYHSSAYVFYIHGMSNKHKMIAGDSDLDMVVGYGAGVPDSITCETWRKDLFLHLLSDQGFNVYEGRKGGMMSGWARNNMNQLFRKWYQDPRVHSLQIEIAFDLRRERDTALLCAEYFERVIEDMLEVKSFTTGKKWKSY
jgi:hypothetical protein